MKVAIIANGELHTAHKKDLEKYDKIICADGGFDKLKKLNIKPDYVIGDMDSIKSLKVGCEVIIDSNQNSTDLMKAIDLVNKLKADVDIYGGIGDNIDHTLSNLLCLDKVKGKAKLIDKNNQAYLVKDKITIKGKKDDIVSIIALTDVKGLTYQGLKWKLTNKNVKNNWIGTRNRMLTNKATISLEKGKILVMKVC